MPFHNIISTSSGGGSGDTFDTIQPDAGTSPVASGASTLTLTSSDASVTITGNAGTDTIDFVVVSGSGDVTGPASSTDNAIVRFDGLTGKLIQNSVGTLSDAGLLSTANVTVTSMTPGSVLFAGTGGAISQHNSAFFWEDTDDTLILGDPGSEGSGINLNGTTYISRLKVSDIGGTTPAQFILHRHSTTIPVAIIASRSNSDTSSHAAVTAGQELFFASASGWTGTHYDTFGIISFSADASGTVSSTSSPGRIDFRVAPDGSDSPAIALSIRQTKIIEMPAYGTGIAHFSSSGVISSSLIVNADVSASAAIDITKIANGTANQLIKANAGATANEFATLSGGTGLSVTFGAGTIALANTGVTSIVAGTAISVSGATGAVTVNNTGVTSIVAGTGISISGGTGAVTVNSTITQYTDELAQDAVGAMVADSTKVSLTYVDATPSLTADIIAGTLVNADISTTAAIAITKIANGTANQLIKANAAATANEFATLSGGTGLSVTFGAGTISLANTGVTSLIATANQTTVSGATGAVTVGTVQSIGTASSPTFTGLTLSGLSTGAVISTAGVLSSIAPGSSGNVLTSNGTTWTSAAPSAGTITIGTSAIASGTVGRVLFQGAGNVFQQDAQLFFDTSMDELLVPKVGGGTATSDSLTLEANQNAFLNTNTGRINIMERLVFNESWTAADEGSSVMSGALFSVGGTITSALSNNIFPTINSGLILRYSAAQIISSFPTFQASTVFRPTSAVTDSVAYTQFSGFVSKVKYSPDIASGTATTDALCGFASAPQVSRANAGTVALNNVYGFGTYMVPGIFVNDLESCTITDLVHFYAANPITSGVTLTNNIVVYVPALNLGTNRYGYYSDLTASANYWDIYSAGGAQSSHEGLFKFGDNVAPTALVHVMGSTTARSSIRIEAGTAPTTPNSGDLWHDSTRMCLQVYCGGTTLGIQKVLFVATAAGTVGGTATETTVAGSGIGSLTLPANFLSVGKTIKIRAWGVYGTKAPAVGTFDLRFKYGSTTLITLSPTLTGSLTNQMWEVEFEFTCRTTGATGTVFPQGELEMFTSATASGLIVAGPTATTTIDTTASSKVDITADWGTSNASNTITCNNFTAEVLY